MLKRKEKREARTYCLGMASGIRLALINYGLYGKEEAEKRLKRIMEEYENE